MNRRHQGDLVWRCQHAAEQLDAVPGTHTAIEARMGAQERRNRIDAALTRLRTGPVGLAQVLCSRYGSDESFPETRLVLRENAAVAPLTSEAIEWFVRTVGKPDEPTYRDVGDSLAALCKRVLAREASGPDTVVLDEIRRAAEALLAEAESAYEEAADGRLPVGRKGIQTMKRLKAFYTVPELARALGISRWTVRRWLDTNRIPYEICRRAGGTRGGRIIVLLSELRTYAPSYFSSIRGELEATADEA
jgi:excisionase family DNA binding protein